MPYVLLAIFAVILVLALWQALGRGPRRRRSYYRAQRLLGEGAWAEALSLVEQVQAAGALSEAWQARLHTLAGECQQAAADQALKERRYEDSLKHALAVVPLLGLDESQQRARVLDAMLAEVRRLFAAGTGTAETEAVFQLLNRLLILQSPCAEASFWQGLCHLRRQNTEQALASLMAAHDLAGKQFLDTGLYVGMLLHRLGRPQEALRYLADANRLDAGCPFVTWQMGVSLVAAGGDSGLALRALQRALGPRGLTMWKDHSSRAWIEAFPETRSWVRRLASKHRYTCPILGGDLTAVLIQGQHALAQAHYRLGNFQEAADLYAKLLQECPPTVPLLRGLGLSLARLQRYDQAYKHLRIALEQEQPKDPFTAGYLALCGALGKPTNPDDKPRNVAWGIRLLARFPVMGNAEWVGLINAVHAEARALNMPVSREDQVQLCEALASVRATDVPAAGAYAHLASTFPEAVQPTHAWLYARAATVHGVAGACDLDLFTRTFQEAAAARAYFTEQQWDFDEVEYTYLARSAAHAPGHFPSVFGADYPPRGELFLLERSRQEEAAGRAEPARGCVEVLLQLAPSSLAGHDRLACLHYRGGDMERAVALLTGWQRLAPRDHWPVVRQAIIEQERGNAARRAEAIDRALGLTRGPLRAAVAFLGARLALREWVGEQNEAAPRRVETNGDGKAPAHFPVPSPALRHTGDLLEACLHEDPNHVEALWCLAAVRSALGDEQKLAAQAPRMDRPAVQDGRFHYLGAVCQLAARDYRQVLELGRRAVACSERRAATGTDDGLAVESHFVMAWAHLHLQDTEAAGQAFRKVAVVDRSPSAPYARALLGRLHFERGNYDEAIRWWSAVDPVRRAEWHLDDPLRQTVLLSGLLAFDEGRYEPAAERFREAGKLGLRDRRLGSLLTLSLVKAGQRLLYQSVARTAPVLSLANEE